MTQRPVAIACVLFFLAGVSLGQVATNDLFNRANGTNLGADWIEVDGDATIASNKLQANSLFQFGWCAHTAFNAGYVGTVIRANWAMNGGGGDAISMIAGANLSSWSATEVRIADNNGDGLADRIFFNAAVNAGAWYSSPSFVNMTTPLASGQVTLWFSNGGNTVNVQIRDLATQALQTYSASGILASPPTGTKVGIGYFGNGTVDDFRAWVGSPTQPCMTLTTPRVNSSPVLLVTDVPANGSVVLAYSAVGAAPISTPLGIVALSAPIEVLATLNADAAGSLAVGFGPLPSSLLGLVLYVQALDATTPALTNHFTITVL